MSSYLPAAVDHYKEASILFEKVRGYGRNEIDQSIKFI